MSTLFLSIYIFSQSSLQRCSVFSPVFVLPSQYLCTLSFCLDFSLFAASSAAVLPFCCFLVPLSQLFSLLGVTSLCGLVRVACCLPRGACVGPLAAVLGHQESSILHWGGGRRVTKMDFKILSQMKRGKKTALTLLWCLEISSLVCSLMKVVHGCVW